jgi:hypothetical protein
MKLGHALLKAPLTKPLVKAGVASYTRRMLSRRREVTCAMTTISRLMEEKGLG